MSLLIPIVIHTANLLGIFTDPFEFDGDYGPEVNPLRQTVFELVVSREALAKNYSDSQIRNFISAEGAGQQEIDNYRSFLVAEAGREEKEYGPLLSQLVTQELIENLKRKQIELEDARFTGIDLENILHFIERYGDQKIFRFLRNNPSELLGLDKALRDKAARKGQPFELPILGSIKPLEGSSGLELKKNLMEAVFTKETLALTKPPDRLKEAISQLDCSYLSEFFGDEANNLDLEIFSTPAGQVFFYWMYQALNLHLISTNPERIEEVNKVKEIFAHTLGDSQHRANLLREKLIAANSEVLFSQESDALVPQMLTEQGLFLPVDRQNPQDGTFVLLRSDLWEENYEVIPIEDYEGFKTGRINVILATRKETGQQFLLASGHGHSTKSEDGRLQISLIMKKFQQLSRGNLQLLIGIDANTKTEEDVRLFREHLDKLGLQGTQVGPTTLKKRMVTAQHAKAGRWAVDEEDYLITLKPEKGGQFQFSFITVGFKEDKIDTNRALPNMDHLSDHYPVGAVMIPFEK